MDFKWICDIPAPEHLLNPIINGELSHVPAVLWRNSGRRNSGLKGHRLDVDFKGHCLKHLHFQEITSNLQIMYLHRA